MIRLTDTHCHLYDPRSDEGTDGIVRAARDAGVHRMVTIGCDEATSRSAIEIASRYENVWATVGLHPHEAKHGVSTIEPLIGSPRVVAIGECGLDYYYDHSDRDAQRLAFAEQIRLAHEHGLALVIHTRDAWPDTLEILDREGVPPATVFHCFSGGPEDARECLDRGAYLSFSGIVTFKNADDVRDALRRCPLDRMLVETDAPYLAPIPHRGRPNQPAFVTHVARSIAETLGRPLEEIAAATERNACTVFGLPAP